MHDNTPYHTTDNIQKAAQILNSGGLVIIPTETFYGIAARIDIPSALARLKTLKTRPDNAPFPLLIGSPEDLSQVTSGAYPPGLEVARIMAHYWPGPLTLILPARTGLNPALTGIENGVAVRLSSHNVANTLARMSGGVITATSANLRGEAPFCDPALIKNTPIGSKVDLIVDSGQTPGGLPSTILSFCPSGSTPRVLRRGAIRNEDIQNLIGPIEDIT
jgi:L-threonylcarbamoyladenylate synthase